jgi:eukaryotic-like serine/threonine-protein kinase
MLGPVSIIVAIPMLDAVAHYRILERVGTRVLGEVYRARDTHHGRTVSLLVVDPAVVGDGDRREQFLHDARAAAALSHPNVAALCEIVEDGDRVCLAFEFVAGDPLASTIGGHPMNARRALDLGAQMGDALAEAHAAGLVHGGLTSSTVIVTPKGNAKLIAAGLAVAAGQSAANMAPEQAQAGSVDWRTDIYALGVVVFEMMTGRLPFAESRSAPAAAAGEAPPRATTFNPTLPREIDGVLAKALASNPADRYESAAIVAAKFRAIAEILEARRAANERAR